MADVISAHTATALVYEGPGQLAAIVLTASSGNPKCTITDSTDGLGTAIFEACGSATHPLIIFFPDRFAPRFATGCHITLAAGLVVTLWTRQL